MNVTTFINAQNSEFIHECFHGSIPVPFPNFFPLLPIPASAIPNPVLYLEVLNVNTLFAY